MTVMQKVPREIRSKVSGFSVSLSLVFGLGDPRDENRLGHDTALNISWWMKLQN